VAIVRPIAAVVGEVTEVRAALDTPGIVEVGPDDWPEYEPEDEHESD
jgi:hypothetical protein